MCMKVGSKTVLLSCMVAVSMYGVNAAYHMAPPKAKAPAVSFNETPTVVQPEVRTYTLAEVVEQQQELEAKEALIRQVLKEVIGTEITDEEHGSLITAFVATLANKSEKQIRKLIAQAFSNAKAKLADEKKGDEKETELNTSNDDSAE